MYLLIDETHIEPYNGAVLKRYIGNRLVKTIANPTKEDLAEFGYMELQSLPVPEYDPQTQGVETTYAVANGKITASHRVIDIEPLGEVES